MLHCGQGCHINNPQRQLVLILDCSFIVFCPQLIYFRENIGLLNYSLLDRVCRPMASQISKNSEHSLLVAKVAAGMQRLHLIIPLTLG